MSRPQLQQNILCSVGPRSAGVAVDRWFRNIPYGISHICHHVGFLIFSSRGFRNGAFAPLFTGADVSSAPVFDTSTPSFKMAGLSCRLVPSRLYPGGTDATCPVLPTGGTELRSSRFSQASSCPRKAYEGVAGCEFFCVSSATGLRITTILALWPWLMLHGAAALLVPAQAGASSFRPTLKPQKI